MDNFEQVSRKEFYNKINDSGAYCSIDNSYSVNYYVKDNKTVVAYSMSLGYKNTSYFINKDFYG